MLYKTTLLTFALIALAPSSNAMHEQKSKAAASEEVSIEPKIPAWRRITVRVGNALEYLDVTEDDPRQDYQIYEPQPDCMDLSEEIRDIVLKYCPEKINHLLRWFNHRIEIRDRRRKSVNILLIGEPGSGRATLAKTLAHRAGLPFFRYHGALLAEDLQNSGKQNLIRIFEKAAALNRPCMIIVDNLQRFIENHDNFGHPECHIFSVLCFLIDKYENTPIIFVGTSTTTYGLGERLISRLLGGYIIDIDLPNKEHREEIIAQAMRTHAMNPSDNISFNADVSEKKLADLTEGYTPRNLTRLVQRAVQVARNRKIDPIVITMEDFSLPSRIIEAQPEVAKNLPWSKRLKKSTKRWAPIIGTCACVVAVAGWAYVKHKRRKKKKTTVVTPVHKQTFVR